MGITHEFPAYRRAHAAPTLREWLRAEPYTLAMSSGFFGFFAHAGVLSVLEDEGLLPARAAGSSAGALVTGCWCAGLSSHALHARLRTLQRAEFWDPGPGLGLLRGRRFAALLDALLPVRTFAECRAPLAVSVFDVAARSTRVLESGALAPALQASCTVPVMFQPVWLDGRPLLDGGLRDRPGLAGVRPGTRVFYHHLSSRMGLSRHSAHNVLRRNVPARSNLLAFEIESLPRVDPFHIERGVRAMDAAARATRLALGKPLPDTSLLRMEAQ